VPDDVGDAVAANRSVVDDDYVELAAAFLFAKGIQAG
jgi:hypothetical protein